MENLRVLNSKEKKRLLNLINEQFECDFDLDYEVFMNNRNRIFLLSKDFSKIEISKLRINSLGLYFGEVSEKEIRLSLDGSFIIGKTAKRNVVSLDDEQARKWMAGEDIAVDSTLSGFVIIKNNDDFLGCGKISNGKLYNYVPKERRVKLIWNIQSSIKK
jgi:NOL1/NOP2/fmu family ribosome biogenesis protein